MATGNLYVCIKPFAAGEIMTTPADDPEHWALYLPRPEKGADGAAGEPGSPMWAGTVKSITSTITFASIEGAKAGDYIVATKVPSGYDGILGNIYVLSDVNTSVMHAASNSLAGNIRGPAGIRGAEGPAGPTGEQGPQGPVQVVTIEAPNGIEGRVGEIFTKSISNDLYGQDVNVGSVIYDTGGSIGVVRDITGDTLRGLIINEGDESSANQPALRVKSGYGASGVILNVPLITMSGIITGYEIHSTTDMKISIDQTTVFSCISITKATEQDHEIWLIEGIVKNPSSTATLFYKTTYRESFNVQMLNSGHSYTVLSKVAVINR